MRFLSFFLFLLPSLVSASPEKLCDGLLQQSQDDLAGACFFRLAQKLQGPNFTDLQKRTKSLFLERSAKAFSLAAERSQDLEKRAYFYEEAIRSLQVVLEEKLCLKLYQCQATRGTLFEINKKIGYAKTTLVNPRPGRVDVQIQGYQYKKSLQVEKQTLLYLRPGRYTAEVVLRGRSPLRFHFELKAEKEQLVHLYHQRRIPVGVWILGGIGVGVALLGSALAIRGAILESTELQKRHKRLIQDAPLFLGEKKSDTAWKDQYIQDSQYFSGLQEAESRIQFGGVLVMGLGLGAATGALIWLLVGQERRPAGLEPSAVYLLPSAAPHPRAKGTTLLLDIGGP